MGRDECVCLPDDCRPFRWSFEILRVREGGEDSTAVVGKELNNPAMLVAEDVLLHSLSLSFLT